MAASISSADAPLRQPMPGDDHGFTQAHCVTGIAGRHPVLPPTGSARAMAIRVSVAAERGVARDQLGLGLERHGIDDEPPAGPQRRDRGVEHALLARAAADEDRIGRGEAGKRLRRAALDHFELGHAEGGGVAADARGALGARLDGDGAQRGIAPASIRSRPSPRRRRCPTAIRPAAARARTASRRGSRAW